MAISGDCTLVSGVALALASNVVSIDYNSQYSLVWSIAKLSAFHDHDYLFEWNQKSTVFAYDVNFLESFS